MVVMLIVAFLEVCVSRGALSLTHLGQACMEQCAARPGTRKGLTTRRWHGERERGAGGRTKCSGTGLGWVGGGWALAGARCGITPLLILASAG